MESADERRRPRAPYGPREHQPVRDEPKRRVVRRQVSRRESLRRKPGEGLFDGRGRRRHAADQESKAGALELA